MISFKFTLKDMRYKALLIITTAALCCSCSDSIKKEQNEISKKRTDKELVAKIDQIEKEFKRGDSEKACELQLSLTKDPEIYSKISPKLLENLKKFQIKCGKNSFSINFNNTQ